ncbi:S-isoprenylcysteine methyltransferase-like protein [Desulfofarcimen acetoxidans DSM 771]|uniref:S-isoprenylcysteine methyltransferase-like protein n=1 Tax=Desulfofarcimen acetoxidans (strain ATCC 49208 / DSM 771 / KCTC 5769 / VKM B-1644 / 5575) TaxID=485916 RepID=C8W131_DESAS|nr:isoprenylcysteine carboxylmethyltransferase family protein [Desulfofarcimen acetoxidans]ACV63427.1 S-isoprenylcysteine methyltransferase-like protein [Desulfofarcimen acetoxidans DSM 771]
MKGKARESRFKAYFGNIIFIIVMGVTLFLSAGSLMYWEAWVYLVGFFTQTIFTIAYFSKKKPELISKRMQRGNKEDTRKVVMLLVLHLVGLLISGFDFRYHWSVISNPIIIISNVIVFFCYVLIFFTLRENSYAHSTIRVEENQQVITSGPYAIVRHPMYLGMSLMYLFTPLALGSYWALMPFSLCLLINILRIINEEKMLVLDLPEYKEYCLKTRYRLIPLIW